MVCNKHKANTDLDDERVGHDDKLLKYIMEAFLVIDSLTIGQYKKKRIWNHWWRQAQKKSEPPEPTNYPSLTIAVKTLTDQQEIYNVFMNLHKTYEFKIHMHNKYKVNMHPGLSYESNVYWERQWNILLASSNNHIQSM
jgi:hypothetical protein